MSDAEELDLEPGETVDSRIASCLAVLKRPAITEKDRRYVKRMLALAQSIKKKQQGHMMSSILTKYGVASESDVIEVNESPDKLAKPTTRKTKAVGSPKLTPRSKKAKTDPSPSKVSGKVTKIKGPPTKRPVEDKPDREPLADDSDVDMEVGSDYRPSSGGSGNDTDVQATPSSKRRRGRPSSAKKGPTRKPGRLPWCSSDTDPESHVPGGITYTEDELSAMYETAQDDPDVIPGKFLRGVLTAEKNARRKILFKKIKRNVNAVGGNNRRKKAIYKKFTDHKNRTKDKHRLLLQKYGKSGAGKIPDSEALTEGEILCLRFWGIEASGCARPTPMDHDSDREVDSEEEARQMREAAAEEKRLEAEYKDAAKVKAEEKDKDRKHGQATVTKGKGSKRSEYGQLLQRIGLDPDETQPDADETARAASLKPRRQVRARARPSDAFKDVGDSTEDGDSQEESIRKNIPYTPDAQKKPTVTERRVTRSSEKCPAKTAVKSNPPSKPKKKLSKDYRSDPDVSEVVGSEGVQEISDTPLDLEEDGQLDYSMTVQTSRDAGGKKTTSTPRDTATDMDRSVSPHRRPAPGGPLGSPHSSQGLPTPKKSPKKQKDDPKDVGKSLPGGVASEKSTQEKSGDQEGLQVAFMHSELTCIRENVEKIAVLPNELTLLRNSVESAQGDLGVLGTHTLSIKSEVASMVADVKNTGIEVNSLKPHVIGLRSDTMALKQDLHGLSKNIVESRLVSRSTKDEVASARVDIVRVGDDVNIAKADVLGVDRKVSVMAGDLAALKHDVHVVKSDVVSIKKELASFKSEMAAISAGVQAIQWSLATASAAQYRDIGMCTEIEQIEVKSESGSPKATAEGDMHAVNQGVANPGDGGPDSLNTSEVSFRPHPEEVTYDKVPRVTKESVQVDSEIDAIADTQECTSAPPGDILFSIPVRPEQEMPVDVTECGSVPDTEEESQSILQFATDGHTETSVMSSVGKISRRDQLEAGPAASERPLEVISEAVVDQDGKTFFVLETKVASSETETQQGENMYPMLNSTQDLPLQPPTPKKAKKVRKRDKRSM